MARQSTATKAKAANEAKAKADKAKKIAEKKREAVAGMATATPNTALTLPDGKQHLPAIPLSTVAADVGGYQPTEDQHTFVNRLMATNDIKGELVSLGRDLQAMQWKLACFCVAMAARLQRDKGEAMEVVFGEGGFIAQLETLGESLSMIRVNSIKKWLEKYAPVSFDAKTKAFIFDSAKHRKASGLFANKQKEYLDQRLAEPFFKFAPEAKYSSFDFDDTLSKLATKVFNIRKMTEDQKKAKFGDIAENLDMEGSELFVKHYSAYRAELAAMKAKNEKHGEESPSEESPSESEAATGETETAQAA